MSSLIVSSFGEGTETQRDDVNLAKRGHGHQEGEG